MWFGCVWKPAEKTNRSLQREKSIGGLVQWPDDTNIRPADISILFLHHTKATSCLVLSVMHSIKSAAHHPTDPPSPVSPQLYPALDENRIESPTYSELSTNTCDAHLYELSLHPHFIPFLYQVKPKNYLLALHISMWGPQILRPYMHIFLSSYMLPSCKRTWMCKTHHKSRSFSSGNHRCSTSFSMFTGYLPVFGVETPESSLAEPARYRLGLPPDLRRDRSVAAGAQAAFVVLRADGRLVRDLRHHRGGLPRAGALEAPRR